MNPLPVIFGTLLTATIAAAGPAPLFAEDFGKVPDGELPDPPFKVLDGQFKVMGEGDNRFVELPGAPLESYGFLFGSSHPSGVEASARIHATRKGRRYPTFAVGLNGASGYRLQVTPAKDALEIFRGDEVVASVAFKWTSGEWTQLSLALKPEAGGAFILEGAASVGGAHPATALIRHAEPKPQPAGKAGVWGMPFSGTPIRFDDLKVTPLE